MKYGAATIFAVLGWIMLVVQPLGGHASTGGFEMASEDPGMAEVAEAVPAFGGVFIDGGVLKIWLTGNASESAAVRVRSALTNHVSDEFQDMPVQALAADYTYADLARWSDQLIDIRDAVPGVVSLGVSQRHNRVEVGVSDVSAGREALDNELARLAIPRGAVRLIEQSPVHQLPIDNSPSPWWLAVGIAVAGLAIGAVTMRRKRSVRT